jgi:hypothetical protein
MRRRIRAGLLGGILTAAAMLTFGTQSAFAAPSSGASVSVYVPPGCTLEAGHNFTQTWCINRAHQAWVKCGDGNWYYGEWRNVDQTSHVTCPNGLHALDHSMSYPD